MALERPQNVSLPAWGLTADATLEREVVAKAIALLPDFEFTVDNVATALKAIGILDEWHAPVTANLAGERMVFEEGHMEAATTYDVHGRFNRDPSLGVLIPRYGSAWRTAPTQDTRNAILREYDDAFELASVGGQLKCTVALPATIRASHPDNGDGPDRDVTVVYQPLAAATMSDGRPAPHRVLVAPILEARADVEMAISPDAAHYHVTPLDLGGRIDSILDQAYAAKASLVFMPEMVLSAACYSHLKHTLRDRHAAYSDTHSAPPELSWLLMGVADELAGQRRNYVAVLASDGEVIVEQHKLSKWNLTKDEQKGYDLLPPAGDAPDFLKEDIEPSPTIHIVDLPAVGRLVVLICADMEIRDPGTWLFANAGINWVYSPIMDRSRSPTVVDGQFQNWIVRRAHRAALATRSRVVVTNSMPLSEIINETNARDQAPYPALDQCHVGLLVDAAVEIVTAHSMAVPIGAKDVAQLSDWGEAWPPFAL